MKKVLAIVLAMVFVLSFALVAAADLKANEKKVWKSFVAQIPKDKIKNIDDLYKKWQEVMAGKSKAILLDVRTHPEFNAVHVEGSSHIHAGHMYTIPKKIKDANAEIWVWCRTHKRSAYVVGFLYKYGYKNVYWVSKAPDGAKGGIVGWLARGYPAVNQVFGYILKAKYVKHGKLKERGNPIREMRVFK